MTEPSAPVSIATKRRQHRLPAALRPLLWAVVAMILLCLGYFLVQRFVRLNLHQIQGTQVYRSAQPDDDLLRRLVQEDGLKSILKLNSRNSSSRSGREEEVAAQLRLKMVYLPMAMHRLPSRQEMINLLNAIESTPRPMLIHCNAGADRTGLAAAMVAMQQGESFDQAVKQQLSAYYLHIGVRGEDVDEILGQYRNDCAAAGVPTGGWTEFKQYLLESYRPGFYHAKLTIHRWQPTGEPKTVQAVITVTNLSRLPFPADGDHPIEVVAYVAQPHGPKQILAAEPLNRALAPGQSVQVPLTWKSPAVANHDTIEVDLLRRQIAWFGEKGSQVLQIPPLAKPASTSP